MIKTFVGILAILLSLFSHAINLSCMKMYGINRGDAASQHTIFRDCFSRHYYELKITNVKPADTNKTYTIRVLPLLKLCKREVVFPFYSGVVEINDIKIDCRTGFTCVYMSPLTRWTNDTWPDVTGDWSRGLVNNTVFVELVCNDDGKILKRWTNAATSSFRTAASIEDGMLKMSEKQHIFAKWLEEHVYPNLDNTRYVNKKPRFENNTTWKEFKGRLKNFKGETWLED